MAELWAVFYGDGTVYESADGPARLAPPENVQAVAERLDRVDRVHVYGGVYAYDRGEWNAAPVVRKSWSASAIILIGWWTDLDNFTRIRREAEQWLDRA